MIEQLPFLPLMLDGHYAQNNEIKTSPILIDKNDPNSGTQSFAPEGVGNPVELLERIKAMNYRTQIFGNAALTFHILPQPRPQDTSSVLTATSTVATATLRAIPVL